MKILASVDFSTTSETILKVTKTYAQKLGAEVFLIHTEPVPTDLSDADYDTKPESMRLRRDALALEKAGVKTTPVFLQGPTCETILSEALRLKVDLIITGAHGHGGANCKVSLGHISECILFGSKIPVLVVPV
ncbi:MAG: universal stress protein [Kiritimatiellales bacterium]|jgi:nucleotide-binding universal stress UspA family protein